MKQITLILLVLITLYSCNKETEDVPDYLPGRLIEVSHNAYSLGLVYHKYEYSGENITDFYYFSSPETFISKYHIEDNLLKEIHYSYENTSESSYTDSIIYFYSDSLITENYYNKGESNQEFYGLKNGKIISSSWNLPYKFIEFYYEWNGDNLHRIINEFWYGTPLTANTTEYVFQYSAIENPFYVSNIPRILKEFNNPHNNFDELTDLIPKCSKNFPIKLRIIEDGPLWDGPTTIRVFSFECKTFANTNKPYEIKMITTHEHGQKVNRQADYFLTYEKL